MMKKTNKGFTLAELLIVVAIIAVLVAIAIPVLNSQLERAKESTDLANIRAAYAEAMADALSSSTGAASKDSVKMTQGTAGWDHQKDSDIGGYSTADGATKAMPSVSKGDVVTVSVASDGTVTIVKKTNQS